MVENNDLKNDNTMTSVNVKLITDGKRLLEESTLNLQEKIQSNFKQLMSALESREKQLLRQVDAVHVQQLSLIQSNMEIVSCKPLLNIDLSLRDDIESQILRLGKLEVFGKNCINVNDTEPYKIQEYQDADKDHESFNKSINTKNEIEKCLVKTSDFVAAEYMRDTNISSDENAVTFDNGTFSCSLNSRLDSSIEMENRSVQDFSVSSISGCMMIQRQSDIRNNESFANFIVPNCTFLNRTNESLKTNQPQKSECINETLETVKDSRKKYVVKNLESQKVTNLNCYKNTNANKEHSLFKHLSPLNGNSNHRKIQRDSAEHPKQIQQWLQQILIETETEPMIHETEQFSEISKVRSTSQFPLET